MTPYEDLKTRFARIGHLDDVLGLLQWDQETVMPDGAAPRRADVVGTVSMLRHRLITDPPVGDLLDAVEAAAAGNGGLGPWDRANLREMRRLWTHAAAVPGDLVEANARATSLCETAWRTARRDSDFNALLPTLGELLTLQRRIGEAKADSLGVSAYDALLDMYEPDGRAARIDALFDDLAGFLPGFTEEVLAHQARRPAVARPPGPFPEAAQRPLALALMTAAGFDFRHGRLDTSAHPFCTGADSDVRITTRYEEDDFSRAILGTLHETGHALYEQGRPAEWRGQPVGEARGMALHESQSLVIEMQACRSREFIDYLAPLVREAFGGSGEAWSDDNLYRMYTRVERSLIRVDADEVTYPAHVILRYRLERAMLAGDLALSDLPGAWNDGMRALVGVTPPDDARGCLQDIHWPAGAWAYFPTYTLGAMAAAQLFQAACRAAPDLLPALARGDFSPLVIWLRANIHAMASSASTDEILTAATGAPLGTEAFKAHLRGRYMAEA